MSAQTITSLGPRKTIVQLSRIMRAHGYRDDEDALIEFLYSGFLSPDAENVAAQAFLAVWSDPESEQPSPGLRSLVETLAGAELAEHVSSTAVGGEHDRNSVRPSI